MSIIASDTNVKVSGSERPYLIIWPAFDYYPALQRVRLHSAQNPSEPLSLIKAADIAAMAPASFARFFRRSVGVPFKHWIDFMRVEHADALFRSSDISVIDAANECGFEDATTFTRTFHRVKGINPMESKRRHRSSLERPMTGNAE